MRCPYCQADIQVNWLACPACGVMLSEKKQCDACGELLGVDWKACPFCGKGAWRPTPHLATYHARGKREFANSVGLKLVLVRAGSFRLRSNEGDDDETAVHMIRITKPFYLGVTTVTEGQWRAVLGPRAPGEEPRDLNLPVVNVSWEDCQSFCQRLTETERRAGLLPSGASYGLPTEVEWEYACRAGADTNYCFGDDAEGLDDYAWHRGNSSDGRHAVAQKQANAWGLYDMHGNVWEWCQDWYGEDYYEHTLVKGSQGPHSNRFRVLRGGSWDSGAWNCRCATRLWYSPGARSEYNGFRASLRGL